VGEEIVWQFAEPNADAAESLSAALGVPSLVAGVLLNRGVSDIEEARLFLDPRLAGLHDPFLLPDVDRAVERLACAIERKEKIFLHGDYDVDGVTSAALFLRALTSLGADIVGFVPRRSDGYDLQKSGVDRAQSVGATLILTADCGSCAIEPIAYANSLGMEVIVTDHHRPGPTLPDAYALVNPYRPDWEVPFQPLCGAGVAFKVCDALVSRLMPAHREAFRHNFVDLAALGTVADVTPLIGENRILVTHGLRTLAEAKKTGLRALMLSMDMLGKPFDTESISWKIGPRLNAAGRMEDADLAYRLLVTRDQDEAEQLAVQLAALAEKSREETARVTTEALVEAMLPENEGRRVLILARERWGKGVIGIAANRIVETFRRPVILLSYDADHDRYHGSARTYGDFNLHDALHECHDLLERFGGHSASAGVSLRSEYLAAFRDKMHDLAEGFISDEIVPPTLAIDAEVTHGGLLTFDLLEQLNRLAPFGRENPEPVFATRGALVLGSRRVGKDGGTCQMRLRLPGTTGEIKAVWFRNGEFAEKVSIGDSVDVAYTPKINEWNGRASIELSVKDMRLSD
jgi:single-stranded-DNA-specific exonuclease